ncbi:MAG: UDP-3-O-(3-hydroxymyristoyl)glucosamine N-acyltransferase [SAR324 cluster bacterium]|nr:UDP-3-O-(3-hydroxymyristoyl)glucosamine N-acyltransferase [SAR324 cluster bacterium]
MKFKPAPLRVIAEHLNGEVIGDPDLEIRRVAGMEEAQPGDLTFVANAKYAKLLSATRASAVIVNRTLARDGMTLLRVDNPYLAFAKAQTLLVEPDRPEPGVHPGAHLEPSATLGEGVTVMAGAYVGAEADIGAGSLLYPGAVVMERVRLGTDCLLYPGAVVREDCLLGDRVILHANATIGSDGFGFAQDGRTHFKIPQVGNVVVGDDVEVGACSCIDRAALGSTVIGSGSKFDDLVMIGHGCKIGENCIVVAQCGIAGSTTLGEGTMLGGRTGMLDNIALGPGTVVYSGSHVTKSYPAGSLLSGNPARPHKENLKHEAMGGRVEKLLLRVTALEQEVAALRQEKKS